MSIFFYSVDIEYRLEKEGLIRQWVTEFVENKQFKVGNINFIFCSDEYIHKNNREFLSHDYTTDVITFDYSKKNVLSGDILISIPTVSLNAEFYNVPFFNELLRVIIHGVLHLMGFNDGTEEEKALMRSAEDLALLFYETNFR